MSTIGGKDYTNFRNVRVRGQGTPQSSNGAAGTVDFVDATGAVEGTLSIGSNLDAGRAWSFPNRSGRFTTGGTFTVDFPAIAATTFTFSTVVTVTGITAQDGITVTSMDALATTARILVGAAPGAAQITLYFVNIGAAANGLYSQKFAYTATRD